MQSTHKPSRWAIFLSRSWIPFSAIWQSSIWENSKKVEPVSSVRRIATSTGVVKRFVKKRAQVAKNGGWGRIRRASTVLYHQGCSRVLIVYQHFLRDKLGMVGGWASHTQCTGRSCEQQLSNPHPPVDVIHLEMFFRHFLFNTDLDNCRGSPF